MGLDALNTTPATYDVVYYVKSPGGIDQLGSTQIVTVRFKVLNQCVSDSPIISTVLSGATLSYTVFDA